MGVADSVITGLLDPDGIQDAVLSGKTPKKTKAPAKTPKAVSRVRACVHVAHVRESAMSAPTVRVAPSEQAQLAH